MDLFFPLSPWSVLLGLGVVVASAFAVGHAVLTKTDVRSATGWVGLVLVFPVFGPLLYLVFGINRIRRRARALRSSRGTPASARDRVELPPAAERPAMPPSRLASIAFLVSRVVDRPLVGGNDVTPLVDGDEAFPAMLEAIGEAEESVALSTYIFDLDPTGREFVEALADAVGREVEVRVLVDAVGARYSFPTVVGKLRHRGVRAARFMKSLAPWGLPYLNLRTHRKILVADGRTGFVGGMNIRHGHRVRAGVDNPVRDLHFRVEGPVVSHLQGVFVADWYFSTGEDLTGPRWFPEPIPRGEVLARVIPDGPDEDLDKALWTVLGAVASARDSIKIMTPYFLPEHDLVTALSTAALKGVEVSVLMPEENNLPYVQWASQGQLPQILEHGCRAWYSPPPFDHSKLMLVDESWALVGSANLDPRSLRLNFEVNVELYGEELCRELDEIFEAKRLQARELTAESLRSRGLLPRLRDGVARLALPYL